jgi:hypothetical protein
MITTSILSEFKPKYRKKKSKSSKPIIKKLKDASSSLFSPREIKFILSGIITIRLAIILWITFQIIDSLSMVQLLGKKKKN